MRNRLAGPMALALALALPTAACSSSGSGGASAGSPGGGGASAGSPGSGGVSAGSPGSGGASGGSSGGGASSGGACSAGGGPSKVTTLDSTKNLKDLTPTEATQLCNDTNSYFACLIGSADRCKWVGLRAAASTSPQSDMQMQSNCSHYEDGCDTGGITEAGADCLHSVSSSCVGTVAQYSACIVDETAAFNTTVKGFPACSGTKVSDVGPIDNAEGAIPPASCAALMNSCAPLEPPNLLTL